MAMGEPSTRTCPREQGVVVGVRDALSPHSPSRPLNRDYP